MNTCQSEKLQLFIVQVQKLFHQSLPCPDFFFADVMPVRYAGWISRSQFLITRTKITSDVEYVNFIVNFVL